MISLTGFQYKLPFNKPLITGNKTYYHREGIILKAQKNETVFWGEAAPLPGFSDYLLTDVIDQLQNMQPEITELVEKNADREERNNFYQKNKFPPSLCFAIDTIASQFLAYQNDKPLLPYLFGDKFTNRIPVNGLTGSRQPNLVLDEVRSLLDAGYQTLKFKVGVNFDQELTTLSNIRSENPSLNIRIDANRSWSTPQALKHLKKLGELNIEYCEEPLAAPSRESLKQLFSRQPVPIALDETVCTGTDLKPLLPYISVLVIKPMVLGSFAKIFATKRLADHHECRTVFTSSLETGIGRMMTVILASGLGSPKIAHGLNTGPLLGKDIWRDKSNIQNGYFSVSDTPFSADISASKINELTIKTFTF